ncbi:MULTISPECIES: DUF1120 domain-containing protein [unclassified Pseudomonas]|uniref:DUF1120 domain-containing protein n=1 Tax=unclassified Pseudomonas TaxID=196821 RepID=UPI001032E747|nr:MULTISPECIES: DUF1120 domain-containing protein [unclassified Pseudomonas]
MKRLLVLPLCLLTHAAVAATSVDITVTGIISPPACDIAMTGNGQIDFGEIVLAPTGVSDAPQRVSQTLSITCAAPSYAGFRLVDNRAATVPSSVIAPDHFGLGLDGASHPIGYYDMALQTILADSATGLVKVSTDNGSTWANASAALLKSYASGSNTYAFDSATTPTTAPKAVTNASSLIAVAYHIQPRNTLDTSSTIDLDGSATFELIYL